MKAKSSETIVWVVVAIVSIVAAGVLTAPLALPFVAAFYTHKLPNPDALMSVMNSPADLDEYFALIGRYAADPTGQIYLLTWIVVLLLIIGAYATYKHFVTPSRVVDGTSPLGNAQLIVGWAHLRAKNDFWNGEGTAKNASLVLSGTRKGYLFDHSVPHWLCVGKTGSGKDQLLCIPSLHVAIAAGFNLLVTGKPELVELSGDTALKQGYERVIFDLNGYPGASDFNLIDLIANYAENNQRTEAQKTARQTAADLIPFGGETNTYFPKAARSALASVILLVAYADIPHEQKNMATVYDIVSRGTTGTGKDPSAPLKDYVRSLGSNHPAYGPAADFLSDGGVTTAGKNVLSTLKEALTIFGDEGIRRITAKSDVSMEDLIKQKTIVYFHLLEEGDAYQVIFTAWFNQWYRVASAAAVKNGGRLPHETAILGNEWGNLGRVECLPQIATLGRSMKLHAWIMIQDLKQMNAYNKPGDNGAGRDKVLGSIGGKVALSLANPEDFEYFTSLVGKRTVRTHGTNEQRHGGARSGNGESYNEIADDLIHKWDWQNRVAVRDGCIVIKGGENGTPGREGVFEMPLSYANKTPAGKFFGLGSEEEERQKRINFYARMVYQEEELDYQVDTWCPDFDAVKSDETAQAEVADDEFTAWD